MADVITAHLPGCTYHPGYYAAFVLDPDGNNIEAVFTMVRAIAVPAL